MPHLYFDFMSYVELSIGTIFRTGNILVGTSKVTDFELVESEGLYHNLGRAYVARLFKYLSRNNVIR